jgi:hypothetical protein
MKTIVMTTAMMILAAAAAASAQAVAHETSAKAFKEQQQLQILAEKAASTGVHVSVETKPVTGAPYTAEAATESIQVLADGNRIVRRTTARVYRDGKGRTRRETLGPDGQIRSIVISDPAAGKSFSVDPGTNTVHHTGVATFVSEGDGRKETIVVHKSAGAAAPHVSVEAKDEAKLKVAREIELKTAQQVHVSSAGAMTWVTTSDHASTAAASKKEDLGQRVIEGLTAKGTRTTIEIPAGAIGNEAPITVIGEEWVSVDLKVLVMTRHADPRTGETTYRLTGIVRGEPDPSLFEPPAGVSVK